MKIRVTKESALFDVKVGDELDIGQHESVKVPFIPDETLEYSLLPTGHFKVGQLVQTFGWEIIED